MTYHPLAIELTSRQAHAAFNGKPITIKKSMVGKSTIYVHSANKRKIEKALARGKSKLIEFSHGELAQTALHHMQNKGEGFWGRIWEKLKKGWNVLKQTGIPSLVADVAVPALAKYAGDPSLAGPARAGLKQLTGVGLKDDEVEKLKGLGLYLS